MKKAEEIWRNVAVG